ncbi:MAG TPA: pirin family protein [Chitinophaga sp.]|nr:pirin family protein [Chitinophaga sp.]
MARSILHKADTRGHADHGWLDSSHTFSFANYYNPERMQFGALRVFNDDTVAGGRGFDSHPHDNMEIISIPLSGALEHKDNLGNRGITKAGEIQVMSTGTGVFHSEYNASKEEPASFLQIWIYPNQLNVTPRYDQVKLSTDRNYLQQIISPSAEDAGTWIYQDAWFHLGRFDKGVQTTYQLKKEGSGLYVFVIRGSFRVNDIQLEERDGLGLEGTSQTALTPLTDDAQVLLIEVPLLIR